MNFVYMNAIKVTILTILIIFVYCIVLYNYILVKKNKAKNAYSSLDIMLKKRYELIPNLVEVVKEYTNHENKALNHLTELRQELLSSQEIQEIANKNKEVEQIIKKVFVYLENYPNLKANEEFLNLQNSLVDVEDHISAARRTYNAHVTKYNNTIELFPNIIFSKIFGFQKLAWFEFEFKERKMVDFNEDKE